MPIVWTAARYGLVVALFTTCRNHKLRQPLNNKSHEPGRDQIKKMKNKKNKQKGFSLIELLIVVAIILIIAAIAIPNLLRSKMAANEASAVAALRTINTSSVAYSTTYGAYP